MVVLLMMFVLILLWLDVGCCFSVDIGSSLTYVNFLDKNIQEWHLAVCGGSSVTDVLDDRIPYLPLIHKPVYSYQRDDCDLLCDDLIERLGAGEVQCVVGFDMEWPVSYTKGLQDKTATIQLCISPTDTYIFHISAIGGLSPLIQKLLQCSSIKLAGIGIEGDLWKLARDFDIDVRSIVRHNMIDLCDLANCTLKTCERWNLNNLTKHVLKKKLNKNPEIRTSDWSRFPLTDTQIQYAATDALACYLIYHELLTRRKPKEKEVKESGGES